MSFFRKWKAHYKHKKFIADADIYEEDEDWSLNHPKLETSALNSISDKEKDKALKTTNYKNLKYLGCTAINTERSKKIVAAAIQTVITNSKAGGRSNKTHRCVTLNVLQEGIEVLDEKSHEIVMRFSIFDISYCSVDAAYDHAFAFVGSERGPLSEEERMSCHVFLCPKRKVAHFITLTLAGCFEEAYQNWRDTVVRNMQPKQDASYTEKSSDNVVNTKLIEVHSMQVDTTPKNSNNTLIHEFVSPFQQKSWISFEDET